MKFKELFEDKTIVTALEGPYNADEKVAITLKSKKQYKGTIVTLSTKDFTLELNDGTEETLKIKDVDSVDKT